MILALALSMSLNTAPAPVASFQQQVDARLKAAFARTHATSLPAHPAPRQGRTPARPAGR
jgi:hypothetical protein